MWSEEKLQHRLLNELKALPQVCAQGSLSGPGPGAPHLEQLLSILPHDVLGIECENSTRSHHN